MNESFVKTYTFPLNNQDIDLECEVIYTLTGKYYPGTREDPPEYPDLDIEEVSVYIFGEWRPILNWLQKSSSPVFTDICKDAEEHLADIGTEDDDDDDEDY